jgi:hypothetical protein
MLIHQHSICSRCRTCRGPARSSRRE